MLANNSDIVLMRAAIAVMAECEVEIVGLDDFEDIITHLKVEPCSWGADRMQEVLNVAVHSYLSEEDVEEATRAAMAEMGLSSNQSPSKQPSTEPNRQQQQVEVIFPSIPASVGGVDCAPPNPSSRNECPVLKP